ncbi:MAG: RNA methyltransferase [Saprospirales bacterium]|nr:RNA methyltransferase [Saprospirales bacterium]
MKLYRNLVQAVVNALQDIFDDNQYADKVIERILKSNPKWGARDRAFIAENTYEVVRWYRLLYEIDGAPPKVEADWWRLFGIWQLLHEYKLPDWEEFKGLDARAIREKSKKVESVRKINESIPDWLDERAARELEVSWEPVLKALNEPAPVVLRVNTLKMDVLSLQQLLKAEGVETAPLEGGDALRVMVRKNLFSTQAFKQGYFEVQDFASQQVAPYLQVEPGMRVIDACAGAGGKALHLAALMQNKGRIIAMDTEGWKLEELKRRARRAGIDIIEARPVTSTKVIKRLENSADRLLLDVPCSGLGVLRRNPDAKWKLDLAFIEQVRQTQQEILRSYSRMLKPGGLMVYATCSILPSENEHQVATFLKEQEGKFELVRSQYLLPNEFGYDGFFMALLVKREA